MVLRARHRVPPGVRRGSQPIMAGTPPPPSSSYHRTFGNIFGDVHPALAPPAGLSSGQVARSHDRGAACNESNTYAPPASPVWQHPLPIHPRSLNLEHRDVPGNVPSARPMLASACTPSQFRTSRSVCPLEPRYVLPHSRDCYMPTARVLGLGSDPDMGSGPASGSRGALVPTPLGSCPSPSGSRPQSLSLETADIVGARPRSVSVPMARHRGSLDTADIMVGVGLC